MKHTHRILTTHANRGRHFYFTPAVPTWPRWLGNARPFYSAFMRIIAALMLLSESIKNWLEVTTCSPSCKPAMTSM